MEKVRIGTINALVPVLVTFIGTMNGNNFNWINSSHVIGIMVFNEPSEK